MQKQIDDKAYWQRRHHLDKDHTASGLKSAGHTAAKYIYKAVEEQYEKLLKRIDTKNQKSLFDAGFGNGYFLKFFKEEFKHLNLFGLDISEDAKASIDFLPEENLYIGDLSKLTTNRKFDIVHCFDVLYHIIDELDFANALINLTKITENYLILHDRFLNKVNPLSSKHVRMRRFEMYNQILNSQGFYLFAEIPTHFIAMRFLSYRLNRFIPRILYELDRLIAKNLHPSTQERLATHWIRIYKRS